MELINQYRMVQCHLKAVPSLTLMWLDLDNKTVEMCWFLFLFLFFWQKKGCSVILLLVFHYGVCKCSPVSSSIHWKAFYFLFFFLVEKLMNRRSGQYFGTTSLYLFSITLVQKHGTEAVSAVNHCVTTVIQSICFCALKESSVPL